MSKETTLGDPVKLFKAAADAIKVPGRVGSGLVNVTSALRFGSESYAMFYRWAGSTEADLGTFFPATLYVYEYGRGDQEFANRIVRFWGGEPLAAPELRQRLRSLGQLTAYPLQGQARGPALANQRFRFLARLVRGAGYRGWILLIDEAELIGLYPFKQRAKAYAEVARYLGLLAGTNDGNIVGLGAVLAFTSDFESAVLAAKKDYELIPGRLRASIREEDHSLATRAERGMSAIRRRVALPRLSESHVRATRERVAALYSAAYQWAVPASTDPIAVNTTTVMRPLIRRWITEWDIQRLYPGEGVHLTEEWLKPEAYEEDADFAGNGDTDFGGTADDAGQ